jgi:rhodanese-related sulfurtransferase
MFKLFSREPKGYQDVEPHEVQEALQGQKAAQLVDVRSKGEYAQGHLPGAKLIPVHDLKVRARSLRPDEPVILYCLSGARSASAARFLAAEGFQDVRNMKGGIRRWNGEIVR